MSEKIRTVGDLRQFMANLIHLAKMQSICHKTFLWSAQSRCDMAKRCVCGELGFNSTKFDSLPDNLLLPADVIAKALHLLVLPERTFRPLAQEDMI